MIQWWIFAKMSYFFIVCKNIIANKILPVNTMSYLLKDSHERDKNQRVETLLE